MAILEVTELLKSRDMSIEQGGKKTLQRAFIVPSDDPTEAVLQGPPYGSRFGNYGVYLKSKSIEQIDNENYCILNCTYESPDFYSNPPIDYVFWDVDISTETQQKYAVKSTSYRTYFPSSAGESQTNLYINEDENRDAKGVGILVPHVELVARVMRKKKYWSKAYQNTIYGLTGKVNDAKFQNWDIEEVLFVGCQKQDNGEEYVSLTYKFLCQKSETASFTTSTGNVSFKAIGWRYIWQKIKEMIGTDKTPKKQTLFVAMDKVYETGDFSALGLTDADSEVTDDTDYGIL